MNELTQEILKELLHYDPLTGIFIWNRRDKKWFKSQRDCDAWNTRFARKEAGAFDKKGYVLIQIDGRRYKSHRLAWMYVHGKLPENDIDHIDTIKNHNCIKNLREVTRGENLQNQTKARTDNKSTCLLGSSICKRTGTFQAQITLNGKNKHLGRFKTAQEAHEAYLSAKRELHPFGTL